MEKLIIDGDSPAKEFPGFKVIKHTPCGKIEYNSLMFDLFFTDQQKQNLTTYPGMEHYQTLLGIKRLANANFLDFFLENPDKIPEIMKRDYLINGCPIYTFYPETVYTKGGDNLFIRFSRFYEGKLEGFFEEIDNEFGFPPQYPALQFSIN
jgi:hypothetical protein